jgi:transposase
LGHVVISVPPEGGARSQLEVRTAPAPRLASETNNDCQVKFELLQLERDILSKAAAWFARETGTLPSGSSGS